jgi:uncharacterized membrane protein/nitrite reductase/ring-hydroxylating ferredoxin subunit
MSFIMDRLQKQHIMKSGAHIKGHPLHPILVSFPIAFFTGALVFDLLAIFRKNDDFLITAHYLLIAGIVMALAAAIPGFIDFLYTVPPESSAKKRATTHALFNLCMLALFIGALIIRTSHATSAWPVVLEGAGFILMSVAGWMGGTLVHRNQVGVDPRYAFAGKWKEEFLAAKDGRVELGPLEDLKRDQMKLIHVAGKRIVIARTEDGLVAFDDRCTHKGGSLAGGMMICGTVQCPWHGSQFDVRNGGVKAGPARENINTYKMETIDRKIYLDLHR